MKNKILHNTIAFFLVVIVILPFAIQTVHALHNHEHLVCIAKEVKHFHNQDTNCSIYHFTIEQNSIDFVPYYDLEINTVINLNSTFYYFKNYQNQNQFKSSRAPPGFIV